jgi:ABC-type polar amino acid transport system ATPase subunit
MTTQIANHEMGFIREVAERVVVFADGDIIESGLPDELFAASMQERTRAFPRRVLSKTI